MIFHGTTILSVRKDKEVVVGGDGQVTLGNTVMKGNAKKVRRLYNNKVLAGFAGATADAFTLFEKFEAKLDKHSGHFTDWLLIPTQSMFLNTTWLIKSSIKSLLILTDDLTNKSNSLSTSFALYFLIKKYEKYN